MNIVIVALLITVVDPLSKSKCEAAATPRTFSYVNSEDACPRIVARIEWGARDPRHVTPIHHPVPRVFIHNTESGACTDQSSCAHILKIIQDYHMDEKGWDDIGYNFLVGEDGSAYEGRGWDHIGAQTLHYNSVSLGIAVIGSFASRIPNEAALVAVEKLISCGLTRGKLAANYTFHGHRDAYQTDCPGQKLYELIQSWPHYAGPIPASQRRPRTLSRSPHRL